MRIEKNRSFSTFIRIIEQKIVRDHSTTCDFQSELLHLSQEGRGTSGVSSHLRPRTGGAGPSALPVRRARALLARPNAQQAVPRREGHEGGPQGAHAAGAIAPHAHLAGGADWRRWGASGGDGRPVEAGRGPAEVGDARRNTRGTSRPRPRRRRSRLRQRRLLRLLWALRLRLGLRLLLLHPLLLLRELLHAGLQCCDRLLFGGQLRLQVRLVLRVLALELRVLRLQGEAGG